MCLLFLWELGIFVMWNFKKNHFLIRKYNSFHYSYCFSNPWRSRFLMIPRSFSLSSPTFFWRERSECTPRSIFNPHRGQLTCCSSWWISQASHQSFWDFLLKTEMWLTWIDEETRLSSANAGEESILFFIFNFFDAFASYLPILPQRKIPSETILEVFWSKTTFSSRKMSIFPELLPWSFNIF